MSLSLEQAEATEGTDGTPPQPCKPKDASSATAVAAPSFRSSRRVKVCIGVRLLMRSPEQRWDQLRNTVQQSCPLKPVWSRETGLSPSGNRAKSQYPKTRLVRSWADAV